MSDYKLSDNVDDSFSFELRGLKYAMRYPRTDEVEEMQKITVELNKAKENNDEEKISELNIRFEDFLYGLISSIEHEGSIKEALKSENIKVLRNFNEMIKAELTA